MGRTSEYPSVQKISEELIETLQEFLKDQASFPGRSPPSHLNQSVKDKAMASPEQFELANSEPYEGTASDRGSAFGSACTSLEDLMSVGTTENGGASPSWSADQDFYNSEEQLSEKTLSPIQSPLPEFLAGSNDKGSSQSSLPIDIFEVWQPQKTDQLQELQGADQEGELPGWELALFESANQSAAMETSPIASPSPNLSPNLLESSTSPDFNYFFQQSSTGSALHQYNPFLQDGIQLESFEIPASNETSCNVGLENFGGDDLFSFPFTSQASAPSIFSGRSSNGSTVAPTFVAESSKQSTMSPTFSAQKLDGGTTGPTFLAQGRKESAMSQTFSSNWSKMAPTFFAEGPKQSTTSPTFSAQNSNERAVAPTFCWMDTIDSTEAPTFRATNPKETEIAPTFSAQSPKGGSWAPTFCAQNTDKSITTPTFLAEFPKKSTMSPTFRTLAPSNGSVAPSFSAGEPNVFTFSVRSRDNETPRVFGSPFAIENDDPFGPFSSVTSTSEPVCNGAMNEETLLHQQRLWLEKQNKIIAKHLT